MRYLRPLVGAVLLATLLAGCTSAPTPDGSVPDASAPGSATTPPRAKPSATPSAEPVNPLAAVTAIIVRPENLDLNDTSGATIRALSYDAEAADFVAALNDILGGEPTVTEFAGGMESSPWTQYDWAGVQVNDDHEANGERDMNLSVIFDSPSVGQSVSVATIQGFQPGGDLAELAEWMDEPFTAGGYNQIQAERGPDIGPRQFDTYANAHSVTGQDFTGSTVIFAPWNFGIGHV
ncbi:hypothetical protein GCM10022381_16820 [Leifsonia kafniensis]|uniref:Uncharacterized protein n=1 Tax=Leifsonia kafniensis TaxID=475957 RepID=A0ABP7KF16_9MICO